MPYLWKISKDTNRDSDLTAASCFPCRDPIWFPSWQLVIPLIVTPDLRARIICIPVNKSSDFAPWAMHWRPASTGSLWSFPQTFASGPAQMSFSGHSLFLGTILSNHTAIDQMLWVLCFRLLSLQAVLLVFKPLRQALFRVHSQSPTPKTLR